MHELSIASSIIELVADEAQKASAKKVSKVELDIGSLAGVEQDALEFAWETVTQNTIVEHAVLQINNIQAKARCSDCKTSFEAENFFAPCPSCYGFNYEVLQGKELQVKSIVID